MLVVQIRNCLPPLPLLSSPLLLSLAAATVQAPQPVLSCDQRYPPQTPLNPEQPSNVLRCSETVHSYSTGALHPSPIILYGNPGMASGQFVNPLSVAPAVVAPPLQTQLHHRGGVVVSHATPNGNPVNCQSNMEPQGGCGKWVCLVSCEGVSGCAKVSG